MSHFRHNNFQGCANPRGYGMPAAGVRPQFSHKPFLSAGQIIKEPRSLNSPPLQQHLGQVPFQPQQMQPGPVLMNMSKLDDVKLEDMVTDDDEQPKEKRVVNNWTKRQRLNKTLNKVKPKSSMAILNEIVKNVAYDVNPVAGASTFKATVNVNGETFCGEGRSKALAQTAAAEEALKHMVLTSPKDSTEEVCVGHCHLLSYALYKLLNSWDVSGNMVTKMQQATSLKTSVVVNPTKKFPANPEKIHPVMLLSQTHPTAEFKEIACISPPNASFTIQVSVNDQLFTGTASKKRDAKRHAAKKACMKLLGVKYED